MDEGGGVGGVEGCLLSMGCVESQDVAANDDRTRREYVDLWDEP